jgi:hypothetical protein
MITITECKSRLTECQVLSRDNNISIRRATAVMAVCHAWLAMGQVVAAYEAIVKDEAP